MTDKKDLNKDDVQFLKDLFANKSAVNQKKEKEGKKEKSRTACPYCGKKFKSVGRHLPYCNDNPEIQERSPEIEQQSTAPYKTTNVRRRRVLIEEEMVETTNWSELITELKPLLKNLTKYIKKLNEEPLKIQIVK
jgi:tRNA(Ile2) C34 agmatinyltransferase TiaS